MIDPSPIERESTEGVARELGMERLLYVFAALSVATLVVLALALTRGHFTQWRDIQARYNDLAAGARISPVEVGLLQIWKPDLGVTDRCTTCHLGAAGVPPIPGDPLFAAHPLVAHDTSDFGCTPCHAGQGQATTTRAAHGDVPHWEDPLIPRPYYEAGCGGCHTHLKLGSPSKVARGRLAFERYACLACHRLNGAGGAQGGGPDLSRVGYSGVSSEWYPRHLERLEASGDPTWQSFYGRIPGANVEAITDYLSESVGAPLLMAGKSLAHRLGCRGCHKINGVGGDLGPDLSQEGRRRLVDLDFAGVKGPHTFPSWLEAHFKSPEQVVPKSVMPVLAVSEADVDALTYYMLSLRRLDLPQSVWPRDRVLVERLGEREFATDGEALYDVFCAACHGPTGGKGEQARVARSAPCLGGPDFLAVASDRFLREAIQNGRPGRKMPAWGTKEGGLRPAEILAIVEYLRSWEVTVPSAQDVAAANADTTLGMSIFARDCAVCHGAKGEGSVGPSLDAPWLLALADDAFLVRTITRGRPDTAMPAFDRYTATEVASVIAAVRALARPGTPRRVAAGKTDLGRTVGLGSARRGEAVYARACAACHGSEGQGGAGTQLANRSFLEAASDAFLFDSFRLGRCRMPPASQPRARGRVTVASPASSKLTDEDLADAVAYVRSWQSRPPAGEHRARIVGDVTRGRKFYKSDCRDCHGVKGESKSAPSLVNPMFQDEVSDGYLMATILRGRKDTPMPHFDDASRAADVVAFLRSLAVEHVHGAPAK